MWVKKWWRYVRGEVRFRAEGGLCEHFLNLLSTGEQPVRLWDVTVTDGVVTASCAAGDYGRLRPFARRTGTRVRSMRYRGMMKTARPLRRHPGFLVGAMLATALYLWLGSRVWVVNVVTEDAALRDAVVAEMAASGIGIGQPMKEADLAAVRMRVIAAVPQVHHISLYVNGCVATAVVTAAQEGPTVPDTRPANIVASRDGLIVSMRVSQGQKMAKVGEAVVAGELLVCGAIETTEGVLLRHADAQILAQTEHRFTVSASETETEIVGGRTILCPTWRFFSVRMPLFTSDPPTTGWHEAHDTASLTFLGVTLPIGWDTTVYTEPIETTVTRTKEETIALARERLDAAVAQALSDVQIIATESDGRWVGNTYHMTATVTVIEDIACEQLLMVDGA